MSEAALEEVSVLSSIYCGAGECELLQASAPGGVTVQIQTSVSSGQRVTVLFHLPPSYPLCPPDVSVSSTALTRTQCRQIKQELMEQAAAFPPEPMVHQLIQKLQRVEVMEAMEADGGADPKGSSEDPWICVLSLDHIRSRKRYVSVLERWSKQLQLSGRILLGRKILVLLTGNRTSIKEFCGLLKTVKVDVDSSGKKCKERMMKVLMETPSSQPTPQSLQGFVEKQYQSALELRAVFEEVCLMEVYQQILPSLRD